MPVDDEGEPEPEARRGPQPAARVPHPRPGARVLRAHRRGRRRRPSGVLLVRPPDRSRRPPLPADELTPVRRPLTARRAAPRATSTIEGRMPWSSNATFLVTVTGDGARARRRSTSRCAASGRCGTSRPACTAARSPPTGCQRGDGLDLVPADRASATARSARARCQWFVDADHRAALLHHPRAARGPPRPAARRSPCSTSSPTTPTARAATA